VVLLRRRELEVERRAVCRGARAESTPSLLGRSMIGGENSAVPTAAVLSSRVRESGLASCFGIEGALAELVGDVLAEREGTRMVSLGIALVEMGGDSTGGPGIC